jgi:hypothetical protein
MTGFGMMTAEAAKPIKTYVLTVASVNPTSGVAITVSPADKNGLTNGTTQFTRTYNSGTVVALTAPATSTGGNFLKWQKGTADYAATQATTVTVSANTTMTAVYGTPLVENTAALCSDTIDNDLDSLTDCADPNCAAFCSGSPEACQDGIDNDLDGKIDCSDTDCTTDFSCVDVNHKNINSYNGPATCIACHSDAGTEVLNSMHGSWLGATPNVTNIAGDSGKWGQTNNYCTDPQLADFACLKCHVSTVAPLNAQGKVDMSRSKLAAGDMDCLQCHQSKYFATFMPNPSTATNYTSCVDGSTHTYVVPTPEADGKIHKVMRLDLAPGETPLSLARTVHRPNNATCVTKCHAKAGGGDGVKRGDISSAMVSPTTAVDIHLSPSGTAQLICTSCHSSTDANGYSNHQIPGRGNDMRGEDIGSPIKTCVTCHPTMDDGNGHQLAGVRGEPDRHVAHVDCTACHIDSYGKGVSTEMSRDWTQPFWSSTGCEGQGAYIGHEVKGSNVIPEYRFWNKTSWVYDRNGTAGLMTDPIDGGLAMSYPLGGISDKLYPFKVHTSTNPVDSSSGKTNFDVLKQFMTGCFDQAAVSGLSYIGESGAYTWQTNKAFQLITHGVAPATTANDCTKCHGDTRANLNLTTISKMDKLGYKLKDTQAKICSQCHAMKSPRTHESMHGHLNKGSGIDCLFCHTFTRPERNLCSPCDPACVSEFVDTNPYPHVCN